MGAVAREVLAVLSRPRAGVGAQRPTTFPVADPPGTPGGPGVAEHSMALETAASAADGGVGGEDGPVSGSFGAGMSKPCVGAQEGLSAGSPQAVAGETCVVVGDLGAELMAAVRRGQTAADASAAGVDTQAAAGAMRCGRPDVGAERGPVAAEATSPPK
jgi:hypothetical protein